MLLMVLLFLMPKVLQTYVWRDFMPGNDDSSLDVSVDVKNCKREDVKEVRITYEKEVWSGKLEFVFYLDDKNIEKGSRHVATGGPKWPVEGEVKVEILIGKKWIDAGKTKIKSTH